jgi:hypothetical protein
MRADSFDTKRLVSQPKPIRLAFINTHPIQYFAPLYADLNESEDLSVTALYLSDYSVRGAIDRGFGQTVRWDVDLLAGYDARFIHGAERRGEPTGFFSMIVVRGCVAACSMSSSCSHTPAATRWSRWLAPR